MRKIFVISLILLFFSIFCISCQNENEIKEILDSWLGSHYSELLSECGEPTSICEDGLGGKMLIYINSNKTSGLGYMFSSKKATTIFLPKEQGWVYKTTFFVDKSGTIYKWKFDKKYEY